MEKGSGQVQIKTSKNTDIGWCMKIVKYSKNTWI